MFTTISVPPSAAKKGRSGSSRNCSHAAYTVSYQGAPALVRNDFVRNTLEMKLVGFKGIFLRYGHNLRLKYNKKQHYQSLLKS